MLSAPLASCVLHVSVAYENDSRRNFHFFHHKCLIQKFLSCTKVVHTEMLPQSDVKVSTRFTGSNEEAPWQVSIPDKGIVVHDRVSAPGPESSSF